MNVMTNGEELVTIRLKKNTWYRAVLLEEPLSKTHVPEEYRQNLYVRISHNEYNFAPDTGGVFRLLSTNLTCRTRDETISDPQPIALCTGGYSGTQSMRFKALLPI